jgi:uncharacterized membrane protein YkoI
MKSMLALAGLFAAAGGLFRLAAADEDPASLLKKTGYTLSEAIAKAGPHSGGGTAVVAELEEEDGKVIYTMEFAQADKIVEVNLDARTGELVKKETENEDKSAIAKACKITLAQAIGSALQKVPGLAFSAAGELKDGKPEIEVQIVTEGKLSKVVIDGASGAVIKVKAHKGEKAEGEKKEKKEEKEGKK